MEQEFTIALFSENFTGMLNRIAIIFTRRKINIESITSSESEIKGIYRYTIVIQCDEEMVIKLVKQIEKQVEVIKAFYYKTPEIIHKEIALYKVHMGDHLDELEAIAKKHAAQILVEEDEFFVLEKTGFKQQTQDLLEELRPFGVIEFVRSGRVAISRPMNHISDYFDENDNNSINVYN